MNLNVAGTIDLGGLTGLSDVNFTLSGENVTLGGLTSFSSANITVSSGGSLSLPGVTSYTGNATTTTLEATGTGSTLTLANLATVTEDEQQLPGRDPIRGPGRRHGDACRR